MTDRLTKQEKPANRRKWWGLTDSATDPAALTDEELAEIASHPWNAQPEVRRLIAALRASRSENVELRAVIRDCSGSCHLP